jgi:hypothetical protein
MEILRQGVLRRQILAGICPFCRCVITVDKERDKKLIERDINGIALVKCPTENCRGRIVIQVRWV